MDIEQFMFPSVRRWPRWARRVFLVTLPLSAPLIAVWGAFWGAVVIVSVIAGVIFLGPLFLAVSGLVQLRDWVSSEWSRP